MESRQKTMTSPTQSVVPRYVAPLAAGPGEEDEVGAVLESSSPSSVSLLYFSQ